MANQNSDQIARLHMSEGTFADVATQTIPLGMVIQSNLNSSNPDGSFTVADSNLFLSPHEILPIAAENKYLKIFSYFIMKLYVVCTH